MKQDHESQVRALIATSHARQFWGESWESMVDELGKQADKIGATEDQWNEVAAGPAPGCFCGFCAAMDRDKLWTED